MLGFVDLLLASMYGVLMLCAVWTWRSRHGAKVAVIMPPITLLKPLCGAEPGLYENLRSFCEQDYPNFQVVFGLRDSTDPALLVARQLVAEFPHLPIEVVVNPLQHGSNCKVSNMINMLPRARYEILVMADSDACVSPDYLRAVTPPLVDRSVGLVTCVYRGIPTPLLCSRLGAMFINEWYMPSVLLAWLFGHQGYASGQTLAMRSETLQAVGGLSAIANHLADDNRLAELVRALGLRVALSPYVPAVEHHEPTLRSLTDHEVRWMRTLRVLRPLSFSLLFLSFSVPQATIGMVMAAADPVLSKAAWPVLGIALMARMVLHFLQRPRQGRPWLEDFWLLPLRDALICWVWFRSFLTTRVKWRDQEFDISADGLMRRLP